MEFLSYTVCFLFSEALDQVLLAQKKKTTFIGKWNGVGGLVEQRELPARGAAREIREETGIHLDMEDLTWLGRLSLKHNCATDTDDGVTLYYYAAVIPKESVRQVETDTGERLSWFSVQDILRTTVEDDSTFAGDGDLQYFVNLAVKQLSAHK